MTIQHVDKLIAKLEMTLRRQRDAVAATEAQIALAKATMLSDAQRELELKPKKAS